MRISSKIKDFNWKQINIPGDFENNNNQLSAAITFQPSFHKNKLNGGHYEICQRAHYGNSWNFISDNYAKTYKNFMLNNNSIYMLFLEKI
jgi:ubiquitin C-terminal hydrolase